MTTPEEIAEVFGIFHDGCIAGGVEVGRTAELVVEIEYLAERIRPRVDIGGAKEALGWLLEPLGGKEQKCTTRRSTEPLTRRESNFP